MTQQININLEEKAFNYLKSKSLSEAYHGRVLQGFIDGYRACESEMIDKMEASLDVPIID